MKPEPDLSPVQTRAIDAILAAPTQEAAAASIRVNVRTIRRWFALPAFASELRRRRSRVLDGTASILATGSAAAARSLISIATGTIKAPPARVAACRAVLEHATSFELTATTDERLAALERLAQEIRAAREVPPWQ